MSKQSVRDQVFRKLRLVALPDSRWDFNFAEFIADFEGSEAANDRLISHPFYRRARTIFVTPDNCLEYLRYRALVDGKLLLVTTYAIKRGFVLLDPRLISADRYLYAATLDGMEKCGRYVSLMDVSSGSEIDLMVTGTGALNKKGIRFGKGHGFFDVEDAMLKKTGKVNLKTPSAAVVADCQLLDMELQAEIWDTVVDLIVTPTQMVTVEDAHKPTCGIRWDLLDPVMFATIPPLQELKKLEEQGLM